ncbi:MAG: ATP-binding protein [Bacteroidales bacterium]|nr:ATP-binding protein [Bacteroidales bacterium]
MESKSLIIKNNLEELERLSMFIEELGKEFSLKAERVFEFNLILEEYITNLINYGYHDHENHEIIIGITRAENQIKIEITDDAGPFNILETPENEDIDKPVEERKIGGLGIHFNKKLADKLEYNSFNGVNKLIVIKKLQ